MVRSTKNWSSSANLLVFKSANLLVFFLRKANEADKAMTEPKGRKHSDKVARISCYVYNRKGRGTAKYRFPINTLQEPGEPVVFPVSIDSLDNESESPISTRPLISEDQGRCEHHPLNWIG